VGRTAVLTACFGSFDQVRPQVEQDIDLDWICVTDDPNLDVPAPWEKRVASPRYAHPCMSAKRYKLLPWSLAVPDRVIWVDANTEVTASSFAREALASINDGVALFAHPRRDCIYEEAEASLGAEGQGGKYADQPIREQVEHYLAEGHPGHAGLWACGTIAWDITDSRVRALGKQWMGECEHWSWQDQLSFPVICRRLGITPGTFPISQLERQHRGAESIGNQWLQIHPHLT
jgi:hypothetical protein